MPDRQPLLADAVDVHNWLEHDSNRVDHERLKRDRIIGQQQNTHEPLQRVLLWWHEVQNPSDTDLGLRLVHVRRNLIWILLGSGVLIGASLCTLALTFEGDYPINLLALLGVLILLPLLFLVITVLFCLLQAFGVTAMRFLPHGMSPGRWMLDLFERFGGLQLTGSYGQNDARARLGFWQVVVFSQWFGVGFYVGAALALTVLVSVSDLAFGWSTTLNVAPSTVHGLFTVMALPWEKIWMTAVPSAELVAQSRIFRLAAPSGIETAAILGTWWKFVLMSLLVWGLLPRMMLLILGAWRLQRATGAYLLQHSEVTALLDRLSSPVLDLGQHEEQVDRSDLFPDTEVPAHESRHGGTLSGAFEDAYILVWNGAVAQSALRAHEVEWLSALSTVEDLERALTSVPGYYKKVVVLTKSWEPPLLEFLDFLTALRGRVGSACSIAVIPVGLEAAPADANDVSVWARSVAGLNDPRTYVMSYGGSSDA
ncbi:MAG: DUF2868 domain-containing protein [bacterium]